MTGTPPPTAMPAVGDMVRLPTRLGDLAHIDGQVIFIDTLHHRVGVLVGDYGTVFVDPAELTPAPTAG